MNGGAGKLYILLALVFVLFVASGLAFYEASVAPAPPAANLRVTAHNEHAVAVTFRCDAGKNIAATFVIATTSTTTGNSVRLSLSDGRQLTLPQTISADGGRYANPDEHLVFWTRGDGAFVQENGKTTYGNCAITIK